MKIFAPYFWGGILKNQLSYHELKIFCTHPLYPTSETDSIKINYVSYIEDLNISSWSTENLIIIVN